MKRWLPGLMAIAGTLAALRAASGCSGEPSVTPTVDATTEASADAAQPRDAGRDAAPKPGERQGWNRWDDYDPKCNFEVPSEAKYLPEPFEWEPCQDTEVTRKLACRRIKKKWAGLTGGGEFISPATTMFLHQDGRLMISTLEYHGREAFHLVAAIDGPPMVALRASLDDECSVTGRSGGGSYYLFQVSKVGSDGKLIHPSGAIGGALTELRPRLLMQKPPNGSLVLNEVAAGNLGFINNSAGVLEIYSWESPPSLVRSQQGNGRYSFVEARSDFFFYAADQASSTERIWTPEGGDQRFVGDSDPSRGAADLNTDGVSWVWGEGEGRTTGAFPIVKIATAPFTRDPSKLQRRIVRGDVGSAGFSGVRFAVGHGYAGRFASRPSGDLGAMIVRLSDGAGWFLPGPNGAAVIFRHILAFTDDEVFTLVRDEHGTNVYRVRLDSLGAFALPPAPN